MDSEDNEEISDLPGQRDRAAARIRAEIDRWFVDHFHGSAVATVTEHFNHVFAATEDLKRRLAEEI